MTRILALLLVLAPAAPTRDAADAAFERGAFEEAADLYDALYDATGDPGHLYRGAQARRRAEQWGAAADRYDRFVLHAEPLAKSFEGSERAQLEQMIANAREQAAACRERAAADEEEVVEEAVPEPRAEPAVEEPPPPRVVPPSEPVVVPDRAPARPWSRDPAAIALVSVGSALAVAGAAMLVAATVVDRNAESRASDHDDFVARIDRAATIQMVAPAPLAVGVALVIGGAIRFAVARKRSRSAAAAGI